MDQHLMVYGYERSPPDNVGVINPQTDIRAILTEAYQDAKFLCEQGYMDVPRLKLVDNCVSDICWKGVHVPSHIRYIFFEIFKNSMRATVEHHHDKKQLPPIEVRQFS